MLENTIKDKRKGLERQVKLYEEYLNIFRNIRFITKKDGTPYQNMAKNIDLSRIEGIDGLQVTVENVPYSVKGAKELHFMWKNFEGRYTSYHINLYEMDFNMDKVDPSRIMQESCYRPYYYMNVEDVEAFIKEKLIPQFEKYLQEEIDTLYQFDEAISYARDFEQGFKEKYPNRSLWWIVKECLDI